MQGLPYRYGLPVLLSDRDIKSEVEAGRVKVEPFDASMIQPSSVDVRLDRFFRTFENIDADCATAGLSEIGGGEKSFRRRIAFLHGK